MSKTDAIRGAKRLARKMQSAVIIYIDHDRDFDLGENNPEYHYATEAHFDRLVDTNQVEPSWIFDFVE
jgi:hypothetical protein